MALSKIETSSLDIGPIGGRRNVVINGSFSVNQRGQISSSAFAVSSDRYIIDRWFFRKSNGTSNSVTLLSDQSVTGLGVSNVLKIQNFNDSAWVGQYVEIAANTFLSGQEVTVSYYAKADSTLSGLSVFLHDNFDGGNHGNPYFTQSQTVSTSWERYSHTMTIGDLANDDSRGYLNLGFGQADTNTTIYLAGIQLELGSNPTPFEFRSYAEELQLCYRYFYRNRADGGGDHNNVGIGSIASNDYVFAIVDLPTTMRTSPSVSYSALSDLRWTSVFSGSSGTPDSFGIGYAHATKPTLAVQKNGAGSGVVGQARLVGFSGTTTGYIDFDAEL